MTDLTIKNTHGNPQILTNIENRLNQRRTGGGTDALVNYVYTQLGHDHFDNDEYLEPFRPHLTTDEIMAIKKFREVLAQRKAQFEAQRKAWAEEQEKIEKARVEAKAKADAIAARKITLVKLVEDTELLTRVAKDAKKEWLDRRTSSDARKPNRRS
jgi:hypothetical protein